MAPEEAFFYVGLMFLILRLELVRLLVFTPMAEREAALMDILLTEAAAEAAEGLTSFMVIA